MTYSLASLGTDSAFICSVNSDSLSGLRSSERSFKIEYIHWILFPNNGVPYAQGTIHYLCLSDIERWESHSCTPMAQ